MSYTEDSHAQDRVIDLDTQEIVPFHPAQRVMFSPDETLAEVTWLDGEKVTVVDVKTLAELSIPEGTTGVIFTALPHLILVYKTNAWVQRYNLETQSIDWTLDHLWSSEIHVAPDHLHAVAILDADKSSPNAVLIRFPGTPVYLNGIHGIVDGVHFSPKNQVAIQMRDEDVKFYSTVTGRTIRPNTAWAQKIIETALAIFLTLTVHRAIEVHFAAARSMTSQAIHTLIRRHDPAVSRWAKIAA